MHEVSPAELEQINRFTRKALKAEDVYVFRLILCDNEVDRDLERFDSACLAELAKLFVGKTGIFDHNMRSAGQTARIFETAVETDDGRKTRADEPYCCIRAKAYMPRTEKNADLITEIEAGIKKETSVGCAMQSRLCSVCGEDLRRGKCEHIPGKRYGGKHCHAVLGAPSDAYEWSFVAVPAQREAGVTKAFSQAEETLEADYAKAYFDGIKQSILRHCALVFPDLPDKVGKSICAKLDGDALTALERAMREQQRKAVSLTPQLCAKQAETPQSNAAFQI